MARQGLRPMRDADLEQVRQLALFADMSDERFDALMAGAFLQRFPAHVSLIEAGEPPDFLHVVVDGLVEMFATHDGHETTISFVKPVATFILAAVVTDKVYLMSARTVQPTRILMVPATAVRHVFSQDAAFARAVVFELAMRYRDMVKELKNQKLRVSLARLANWILDHAEPEGTGFQATIPYDKRTLAARIGITSENLSRNFAALEAHGVRVNGRIISMADRTALTAFARPDPLIDDPLM
jgi:CRP/FNR family transcriptional activator FtrB